MESIYAREQGSEKAAAENQAMASQGAPEQETGSLPSLMETPAKTTDSTDTTTANPTDDAFGFAFASLPKEPAEDSPQQIDEQWKSGVADPTPATKTEEGPGDAVSVKTEDQTTTNAQETTATTAAPTTLKTEQNKAPAPRKSKPAITINTGSHSTNVGSKRPPPTPVSPPTFSWNDILRVQNLIERCLQQYLTKNEILLTLKQQANVEPAFSNVVWQKLEEQNPTFFRAYSLQLQLKEQIIAFNYLVGQQKEMAIKGGKRLLGINRGSAARVSTSCSLSTTPTTTTLPPISMDARTFLRTPIRSVKKQRTPAGRQQHMNTYQLSGNSSTFPPSPLPLPSPIKTDLDTHAFFT